MRRSLPDVQTGGRVDPGQRSSKRILVDEAATEFGELNAARVERTIAPESLAGSRIKRSRGDVVGLARVRSWRRRDHDDVARRLGSRRRSGVRPKLSSSPETKSGQRAVREGGNGDTLHARWWVGASLDWRCTCRRRGLWLRPSNVAGAVIHDFGYLALSVDEQHSPVVGAEPAHLLVATA